MRALTHGGACTARRAVLWLGLFFFVSPLTPRAAHGKAKLQYLGAGWQVKAWRIGDRMRFFQPEWFVGDARALRPSPAGGYYALFGDGPRGLRVFTREGFEVDLPTGISNALTVAWSPDERWTAVATANSVYVFPSRRPAERVVASLGQ